MFEWFQKHQDTHPFRFKRKDGSRLLGASTSKTYIMNRAKELFSGLSWFKEGYTTTEKIQGRRTIDFTSSQLRDLRLAVLSENYGFDETDLAKFGSWYIKSYNELVNVQVEKILQYKIPKEEVGTFYENGKDYLFKLLIPYEDVPKLTRKFKVDDNKRLEQLLRAGQILLDIQKINTWSVAKINSIIFKENMMTTYDIMNDCNDENHFKTTITNLEKLFDVKLEPLRKLVKDPPQEVGSIILFQLWLDQNKLNYDKNMIQTWLNINKLRNNLLHTMKPKEFMNILTYFGVEFKDPIDYSLLWENILIKFQASLIECFTILNECEVYN